MMTANSIEFQQMVADYSPNGRLRNSLDVEGVFANGLAYNILYNRRFYGEDVTERDAIEMINIMEMMWEITITPTYYKSRFE